MSAWTSSVMPNSSPVIRIGDRRVVGRSISSATVCSPARSLSWIAFRLVSTLSWRPITAGWITSSWWVSSLKMKRAFCG